MLWCIVWFFHDNGGLSENSASAQWHLVFTPWRFLTENEINPVCPKSDVLRYQECTMHKNYALYMTKAKIQCMMYGPLQIRIHNFFAQILIEYSSIQGQRHQLPMPARLVDHTPTFGCCSCLPNNNNPSKRI